MLRHTRSAGTCMTLSAGVLIAVATAAHGQVADSQLPLNYNFHGMVHSAAEVNNADGLSSYRSRSTPFDPTGKKLVSITFSNPVGYTSTANMNADISSPGASGFSVYAATVRDAVPPACGADVAGLGGSLGPDGQLTVDDIVVFLSHFFSNDIAVCDLAQLGGNPGADGQITVDDLVRFLSLFFSRCGT